jgi:hypothetical protein
MKILTAYSLPPREETLVTLFDDQTVEISQTSALGEVERVRIDTWDLDELIDLLDMVRRYKPPAAETPPAAPKAVSEIMHAEPAKKKGPPAAD